MVMILKKTGIIFGLLVSVMGYTTTSLASENVLAPPEKSWSFDGPFGTFDRAAAQRGFHVFKDVCASCHSISLIRYRNLEALGFSPAEVKAIAAEHDVKDGPDDEGEMFERRSIPSDIFFKPYENDNAARAANDGSMPVDLSLIVKARPHGADYLYALLTGFGEKAPEGVTIFPGKYYNPYFPGGQIAMPTPLNEGLVEYDDGTPATVDQMARDVTVFLAWASEPEMEDRKQMGLKMLIMFAVLTILLYFIKKFIWRKVK